MLDSLHIRICISEMCSRITSSKDSKAISKWSKKKNCWRPANSLFIFYYFCQPTIATICKCHIFIKLFFNYKKYPITSDSYKWANWMFKISGDYFLKGVNNISVLCMSFATLICSFNHLDSMLMIESWSLEASCWWFQLWSHNVDMTLIEVAVLFLQTFRWNTFS